MICRSNDLSGDILEAASLENADGEARPVGPVADGDDREVRVGDEVTLIDPHRSAGLAADDLAGLTGIGDYKLLIGLNPLLPRDYQDSPR